MVDIEGPVLRRGEEALLASPAVVGVVLFARNYQSPEQLRELTAALGERREGLLIAVDQEGGRVQRFREGFLRLPSLRDIAQAAMPGITAAPAVKAALATATTAADVGGPAREPNMDLVADCGWAMAAELLHHGVDFSFAPVLDIYNPASRVIGSRAFATTVAETVPLAAAYIRGMHEAGMAATGKHYPGHGTVAADSHHELPVDRRSRECILGQDYRVFAECIGLLQGVMPGHVLYPAVDDVCAGFSRVWIDELLRGELGFDGVVFSDDLSMAAAKSGGDTIEQRAEAALEAGCDVLLVCNAPDEARRLAVWMEKQSDASVKARLQGMVPKPGPEIKDLYQSERWQRVWGRVRAL